MDTSTRLVSPSKLLTPENDSFKASLLSPVQVSAPTEIRYRSQLRPLDSVGYEPTDIFSNQPSSVNTFYIFDVSKYPGSSNPSQVTDTRRKLQSDLTAASKKCGAVFVSQHLQKRGGNEHQRFFHLRCNLSMLARSSNKRTNQTEYKIASTNGTRQLHGRVKGSERIFR